MARTLDSLRSAALTAGGGAAIAVLSPLLLVDIAHAASFDCNGARTTIEKLICADVELSALDSKLGETYSGALSTASRSEARRLRGVQRRWLHIRDACQEPIRDCLIALYQSHLAELSRTESPPPAFISKTDTYKSEAEKLTKILQVAGARTYVAMGVSTTSYCVRALHDLQSGSEMKAVEPEVRARSEDDPKLAKFHRCDRADQSNAEDLERAFLGFYMLGGAPYRYYRVDVDGDRDNGLEDILYSGGQPTDKTGRPGYDWIDLDGCSFRGGAPLSAYARPWTIKPGQLLLNVLVAYRGDIVAIELVPAPAGRGDPGETKYDVWLTRLRAIEDEPRGCSWREEK